MPSVAQNVLKTNIFPPFADDENWQKALLYFWLIFSQAFSTSSTPFNLFL